MNVDISSWVGISPEKEKEKRACLDVAFTAAAITFDPLVVVRSTEILRPRTQMYLESRYCSDQEQKSLGEAQVAYDFHTMGALR